MKGEAAEFRLQAEAFIKLAFPLKAELRSRVR